MYSSSRQEDFWKKGALKNSCSVNLSASSVVKILENYLRGASFHLKMSSFAGIFKDCDESV